MRVKLFEIEECARKPKAKRLERQINDWLEKSPGVDILDVRLAATRVTDDMVLVLGMILYDGAAEGGSDGPT